MILCYMYISSLFNFQVLCVDKHELVCLGDKTPHPATICKPVECKLFFQDYVICTQVVQVRHANEYVCVS